MRACAVGSGAGSPICGGVPFAGEGSLRHWTRLAPGVQTQRVLGAEASLSVAPEPEAALLDLNAAARLEWEREVLKRAQGSEPGAFGELYEEYAALVYSRVLLPKLGDRTAAEDALSETFGRALSKIGQFEPRGSSVYFWFARIASNKAMDMHRARGATGRALVNLESQLAPLLETPILPDNALDSKRQYAVVSEHLTACLAALTPRYRAALQLRFFEELERAECAERMELKLGTFDVLLLRAVKALRKHWEARQRDVKQESRVEPI